MASDINVLVDRWTAIDTNDDGVTVTHFEGYPHKPVYLLQMSDAPASPYTSDFVVANVKKIADGHFEAYDITEPAAAAGNSGSVEGGFAVKDLRIPLNWRMQVRVAGTSRQILLDLSRRDYEKITLVSGQTVTGLQFKGRQPAGSGSRVNFTNTATLFTLDNGESYRFKWALTEAEATNWAKEGIMQLELPLSIGDTFQAWATFSDTQPSAHRGVQLPYLKSVVLVSPATGKWYCRARWKGSKLSVEDDAA